jgi:hypothetical protein
MSLYPEVRSLPSESIASIIVSKVSIVPVELVEWRSGSSSCLPCS